MKLETFLPPFPAQGILFCTGECLKAPLDLLKIYLHESNRVYRDKLVEEQDFQLFDRLQADTVKKFYEVRVLQSSAKEDKSGRLGREGSAGSLGCLLCVWTWTSVANTARRGEKGMLGENINQCGVGPVMSVLSAWQIGKHFNGFLSTAPSLHSLALSHAH